MIGRLRLVLILLPACAAAVLFAAAFPDGVLAGDSLDYRNRMIEMFSGKIPYFQFPFEHLPVMILPMAAAWLLGGSHELRTYAFALAAVSSVVVLATGLLIHRIEADLEITGLTLRWLLLTVPLLPFLLFRNDSFAVLLAMAGILFAIRGKEGRSLVFLGAGTLAKGWPALWAVADWWKGRRGKAALLASLAVVSLGIQLSPAFQAIQDPQGVHSESLTGGVVGLIRAIQGADLELIRSASVYIDAPGWLLAFHVLVGALIAATALSRMRGPFAWGRAFRLMGAFTTALILASPFFSTQYVAWVSPFAASEKRAAFGMLGVNLASLILLTTWNDLFDGPVWWWGLLVARNLLFAWVGLRLARISGVQTPSAGADHLAVGRMTQV